MNTLVITHDDNDQVGNGLLGSNSELVTALDKLALSGSFEDGYAGLDDALSIYPFRDRASVNIVLVTDEDRDIANSSLNYQTILSKLKSHAALLNVVANVRIEDASGQQAVGIGKNDTYIANGQGGFTVSSGGTIFSNAGSTKTDYADLALATQSSSANGAVWDLNQLHDGGLVADSFTKAFIAAKVEEVRNSIVILDDGEGTFEVCANNEVDTLVITTETEGGGGDYCIEPFPGKWSPGDAPASEGFYDHNGGSGWGMNLHYLQFNPYSLVAADIEKGNVKHQEYGFEDVLGIREFPIYSRDIFFFKMNDTIGAFDDNIGCLTLKYRYRGPIGGPLTGPYCNLVAEE